MACSKNNCSSCSGSSGCGCFGALNCVAGPLTHCGCCTGNAQYYQNYPFYTGPCGTVNCTGCGCGSTYRKLAALCGGRCWSSWSNPNGWNNSCSGNWSGWNGCNGCGCCTATVSRCASRLSTSSAHFLSSAPLMAAAGEALSLDASQSNTDCYCCSEGGILIRQPGTYMAIYTLHVPAMQSLSTRLFLTLNGDVLEESVQDVAAAADGTTNGSSAHLIFHALPNSLLRLVTAEDISLTGCEGVSAVKLTLVKLN